MSSQDRLEHVLRDIHIMISKSEAYDTDRIIVSKKDVFDLIDRLNASVYEIMDEYELTKQSRDRALRENKKEGDKIIWDASRQAEDIYAASVMYTDEALNHLHGIMEYANDTIGQLYKDFAQSMREQQEMIRDNQLELKSQLQLLTDTEKYLKLIEERNREIERERARKKGKKMLGSTSTHKAIKPEIKINEAYFRKAGIPLEPDQALSADEMEPLADEGVIESTLKKVSEDLKQEVLEETGQETGQLLADKDGVEDMDVLQELGSQAGDDVLLSDRAYDTDSVSKYDAAYDTDFAVDNGPSGHRTDVSERQAMAGQIKVNLNAEYFKRVNSELNKVNSEYSAMYEEPSEEVHEPHHGKPSLLDKIMGKKK